jgi:hypothetical protein
VGRLYVEISNSMSARLERRGDGKKLSGSNSLSFRSANTSHDVLALDEIIGFLQSGTEFTCVLPAKDCRLNMGGVISDLLAAYAKIVALCCLSNSGSRETSID